MTPSPVSPLPSSMHTGPASVVGHAPGAGFSEALAQQRASQAKPPARQANPPPAPAAVKTAPAPAPGAARPPNPAEASRRNEVADADRVDDDSASDGQGDTHSGALEDPVGMAHGTASAPGTPARIEALLSRLTGTAAAATPDEAAAASATRAADTPWLAQAAPRGQHPGLAKLQADAADPTSGQSALLDTALTGRGQAALQAAADAGAASGGPIHNAGHGSTTSTSALQTGAADPTAQGGAGSGQSALPDTAGVAAGAAAQGAAGPLLATTALPGAAQAAQAAQAAPGSAAAPLPEARLAAPPGHADFAPQLGAQISVFARDGVQHARLQLNPAEMGPITVQIRLDGGAAQVHLVADNALTRQALEQAMPTLAGSLREGGLTLTGGGVFEQPGQPGQAGNPGQGTADGGAGRSGSGGPSQPARADGGPDRAVDVSGLRRRGVVDLVA